MNRRIWRIGGLAGAGALACVAGLSARAPEPPPSPSGVVPAAAVATVKPAALVNGESIPMSEVEAVLRQSGPSAVAIPAEQRIFAQRQALAALIDDTLWHQFLLQNAPKVSEADVQNKLLEMDLELKKEHKSLAEFIHDTGVTEERIRTTIGYQMRWQAYAQQHVTDAMVEKYYNDFKEFFDGVEVKVSHIVLRVPPVAPPAELQAARDKLKALREEIVAGKIDFAEAAKKNSQCPSAPNGGDIGFFPRKGLVEESFATTAFGLKVGDVSEVVQTDYGLHLIKVTDRKPGKPSEFAKIKEGVREVCAEEMRVSLLAKLRKEAKIEVNLP
jgi:peptidyl-prolyl cis-trans isomerase C